VSLQSAIAGTGRSTATGRGSGHGSEGQEADAQQGGREAIDGNAPVVPAAAARCIGDSRRLSDVVQVLLPRLRSARPRPRGGEGSIAAAISLAERGCHHVYYVVLAMQC